MPDDVPAQNFAWRFLMTFDGATLSIAEVSAVEMRVGSSDPTDDMSGVAGFWYELLDANGVVLFRRITSNPMMPHAEISSSEGEFTRGTSNDTSGAFEIVTPQLADAVTLAVVSSSLLDEEQGTAAAPIATFDLGGFV